MMFRDTVIQHFTQLFGAPTKQTEKVVGWESTYRPSIVVQIDIPADGGYAIIWLPDTFRSIPTFAKRYDDQAGRHSNTYPFRGLSRGKPAIRFIVGNISELDTVSALIRSGLTAPFAPAVTVQSPPPPETEQIEYDPPPVDVPPEIASEPVQPVAPRRDPIPRAIQREVWQRDGGRCVECGSREFLQFDHIVPHSRGGATSVANLQILCRSCNASKNNRI